ncbi:hypothetical protein AKJ08_3474 [Vulgatibacter incomptus]|uniref:Peptidase MA-like domain-containing protein n=1 Tax=Vulgatibacter incomptus TaxID=1391653 RepID=A0A0K1PHU9_9BACT|nr:hypothetical protein AKJ08_3474 [Vulgatibacter incomptus]
MAIALALPAWAQGALVSAENALAAWDLPTARALADELRRAHPAEPKIAHLLGRVLLHQGDYDGAVRLLEEAGASDGPGSFLQVARDTGRITHAYIEAESEHFVFRYPAGKDEILVPWALQTLEQAYAAIGEIVDYRPEGAKIRVEVVADANELAQVSTLSLEAIKTTGTIAICKFDKLMITSPKALARGYDWRDTLSHELVHLIVTRKTANRTPIWLHEGIAKFLETAWRGEPGQALQLPSQALLRDAVKAKKLIPFEKMHPSIALLPTAEDAALAFAEVFSAMEFVYGKDQKNIASILGALRDGASDRDAVGKLFGGSFPRFESTWKTWLDGRTYPKEAASMESLHLKFKDDAPDEPSPKEAAEKGGFRDLTDLSEFRQIKDAPARRAAHLGELLRARGKTAAAAAKYEEAVARVGAQFPSLSNKYAIALLELKENEKATRVLQASRRLYPTDPLTNLNLARASMQDGKNAEARAFLEAAISVNPFDPEAQARLHLVAKELQDEDLSTRTARAMGLLGARTDD